MRRTALIGGYLLGLMFAGFFATRLVSAHHSTRPTASPLVALLTGTPAATGTTAATVTPATTVTVTATATEEPSATPAETAAAQAPAVPSSYSKSPYGPNRLIIPALGINSGWLGLGFLADGLTMASPPGPRDLGWYTFSGAPGGPGNAIFAGHVDWYTGAPAIFGGLGSLGAGAPVQVSRWDGTLVTYYVVSSTWYDFLHTDASAIIAPTSVPTITLITCGGAFNSSTHEYDKRLVVRAVAR